MSIEKAYNSWADQYDTNANKTRDLDQIATIETLGKLDFNTVLELGCGTGKNTEWLIKQAKQIIGFDFSEKMLEKARQKITSSKVQFIKTDLNQKWNIPNDYVELITSSLTLEHIKNLDFIFEQATQKLQDKGKFFICELHPIKQYLGSKAQYNTEQGIQDLEVYIHHTSEYIDAAQRFGFKLLELKEWFEPANEVTNESTNIPRLISFVFEK